MKKAETAVEYEAFYTFSTKKRNLLKIAIDSENHDLIRTLFTKKKVKGISVEDLEEEDYGNPGWNHGFAPLRYAYENGKTEVIMTLLECGLNPAFEVHMTRSSLVETLIRENNLDLLRRVLPYVKEPHQSMIYLFEDYQIKTTLLGLCACMGNVEAAKLLVEHGFLFRPWSVEEALETNEDCEGVYQGSFTVRKSGGSDFYGIWLDRMLEPWQFAAFCEDPEKASYFFAFGEDGNSEGFSEMILYVKSKEIIDMIEEKFPKQMKLAFGKKNQKKILAAASADLLMRFDLKDIDMTDLGTECCDVKQIVRCYEVLKKRLARTLTLEEKRILVKLMLQRRSEELLHICEREWASESEPCDISEWADEIPISGPTCKEFVKKLERSPLTLAIHPEHSIFDERYYYFDPQSGMMRQVRCLDHVKNLSVLDRIVKVIPPNEEGDELLYFTQKVLDMGKKTAFERLKKWGLVHEGNIAKVSEYIVENNLEQFYDQAIRAGETKTNQKTYAL